jgi:DNA-binding response OmpR family regulator
LENFAVCQGGRVIVIASDEDMLRSLRFMLEAEGFFVEQATGDEAIGNGRTDIDCIVIDENALGTAAGSGIDFGRHTAIVLAERPDELGVTDGYRIVQKPLLGEALIDEVRAVARPCLACPDARGC